MLFRVYGGKAAANGAESPRSPRGGRNGFRSRWSPLKEHPDLADNVGICLQLFWFEQYEVKP